MYTRIDHVYVDHNVLELLQSASVGIISISDHAPVTVAFALPTGMQRAWTWRLNDNLLDDVAVWKEVADTLTHYLREDPVDKLNEGVVWEAHKAVIKGEWISQ